MDFVLGIPTLWEEHDIIEETLTSVINSTLKPKRVYVIENGLRGSWSSAIVPFNLISPQQNLGAAASWNLMHKLAAPLPIVLLNADMAVAPDTFEKMFEVPGPAIVAAYGFGCIRIDHEMWQRIGDFDEDFWPAYYEDADYRQRCRLADVPIIEWDIEPRTEVSVGRTRSVHGIVHGKAEFDWRGPFTIHHWIEKNKARFVEKWGGMPDEEEFTVPYGLISSIHRIQPRG